MQSTESIECFRFETEHRSKVDKRILLMQIETYKFILWSNTTAHRVSNKQLGKRFKSEASLIIFQDLSLQLCSTFLFLKKFLYSIVFLNFFSHQIHSPLSNCRGVNYQIFKFVSPTSIYYHPKVLKILKKCDPSYKKSWSISFLVNDWQSYQVYSSWISIAVKRP